MKFATARGSVRIEYDVLGTGTPIVMLHDFGESSRFWCEYGYVKICLTDGRQVVLVDLRGHGGSIVDATVCDPINCSWDVIAVLDHAGIGRADYLGYGLGGRIALCIAAWASDRVHAIAVGGVHPFAERTKPSPDTLVKRLESWVKPSNDRATLSATFARDWPDISEAVARSGVPVLLFVGEKDPHRPLSLSFAEQSGAEAIVLAKHDYATTAAAGAAELLPQILRFFESTNCTSERRQPSRWPGS